MTILFSYIFKLTFDSSSFLLETVIPVLCLSAMQVYEIVYLIFIHNSVIPFLSSEQRHYQLALMFSRVAKDIQETLGHQVYRAEMVQEVVLDRQGHQVPMVLKADPETLEIW